MTAVRFISNIMLAGSRQPSSLFRQHRRLLSSVQSAEVGLNQPFKLFKLNEGPKSQVEVTRDEALQYLRDMSLIRRLESTANALYKEKLIRGFLHLCNGQEAVYVGTAAGLTDKDPISTSYRCHGFAYARGVTVEAILSELTGSSSGCSRGKGGSMHMYNAEKSYYGGNGIVGAQVPVGLGLGFALKYTNTPAVSFVFYGDGAANQGQVFESFNLAKLLNVPVVFVCENNGYGMGTSSKRSSASVDYYTRGDFIPGLWVNAMDVLAVKEGVQFAKNYCLENKQPLVLEMATYRYLGHSVSDPGISYRTRQEIENCRRERDPINTFRNRMIEANLITQEDFETIERDVRKTMNEAEAFARSAAPADPNDLCKHVYVQKSHNLEIKMPDSTVNSEMAL